jgi:predicted metal-binding protein
MEPQLRVPLVPEEKIIRSASKPILDVDETQLKKDLEKLLEKAKEAGATEATIIPTDKIVIDERVRLKCRIPLCFGYNTNPGCPPLTPTAEETREIVSRYRYGILMRLECPPEDVTYPKFLGRGIIWANKIGEVVSRVEAEANYIGYYLATGFKGGPCGFCGLFAEDYVAEWFLEKKPPFKCAVLNNEVCRHYLKSRPAMEASGIDSFATARNVGWEMWVIMPETDSTKIPCSQWIGLVLVA